MCLLNTHRLLFFVSCPYYVQKLRILVWAPSKSNFPFEIDFERNEAPAVLLLIVDYWEVYF